MKTIQLEDWQVKSLRNYFGENDSTQTSHWAYKIFNEAKPSDKDELISAIKEMIKDEEYSANSLKADLQKLVEKFKL